MGGQVRMTTAALELPGGVTVRFMRTLRLPVTGTHRLPPGLGAFPLRRVKDYPDRVPAQWLGDGGVLLPVYQREAVWLSFSSPVPAALQVGAGPVCAVSGRPWSDRLSQDPQNYLVLPRQPWLDGVNSGYGTIRQFVAVPLGSRAGEDVRAGVRLQVFELRPEALERWRAAQARRNPGGRRAGGEEPATGTPPLPAVVDTVLPAPDPDPAPGTRPAASLLLPPVASAEPVAGGRMRQEVFPDERPLADWREVPSGRVFVHLATAPQWREITGEPAPASPVTRSAYTTAGLPWLDWFDADAEADIDADGPGAAGTPAAASPGEDVSGGLRGGFGDFSAGPTGGVPARDEPSWAAPFKEPARDPLKDPVKDPAGEPVTGDGRGTVADGQW